jgi:hypothetical protein
MLMLYKSCRIFHKDYNKTRFAFFDFSMVFYAFYNIQQLLKHYFENLLSLKPLVSFKVSQIYP